MCVPHALLDGCLSHDFELFLRNGSRVFVTVDPCARIIVRFEVVNVHQERVVLLLACAEVRDFNIYE